MWRPTHSKSGFTWTNTTKGRLKVPYNTNTQWYERQLIMVHAKRMSKHINILSNNNWGCDGGEEEISHAGFSGSWSTFTGNTGVLLSQNAALQHMITLCISSFRLAQILLYTKLRFVTISNHIQLKTCNNFTPPQLTLATNLYQTYLHLQLTCIATHLQQPYMAMHIDLPHTYITTHFDLKQTCITTHIHWQQPCITTY